MSLYIRTILIALATFQIFLPQSHDNAVVTYLLKNNGTVLDDSLNMFYKDGIVGYKSSARSADLKEEEFINYINKTTFRILKDNGETFFVKKSFVDYEKAEITDETEIILGYKCRKAVVKIKSNTIEIWFNDNLPIKGSPWFSVTPGLGLILKLVRNRDYEIFADNIEFRDITEEEMNFDISTATEIDDEIYLSKLIESRYKTITVFNHEQINYGDSIDNPDEGLTGVNYRYSNGTVLLKKIKLPEIKQGSIVIAEVNSWSNGDAYDRNGSLFIVPVKKNISFLDAFKFGIDKVPVYVDKYDNEFQGVIASNDYDPVLELMRFFTPFGVKGFNNYTKIAGYIWEDSAKYSQEITDLIPHDGSEVWIGIFIGNYDKGGHFASVKLKIHPPFHKTEEHKRTWIQPIFNTMNIMEMSQQNYGTMFHDDSLEVKVEIPEGLKSLYLRYTSTGHGGWGRGDEFNPKLNEIFIDDELIYKFVPWRDDCATYRLLNPASGNFRNGLTSSDLSRSNWCPGTVTIPEIIPLDDLTPGMHTFKIAIPIGEKEGGSFSAWNISGTLVGEYH